MSKNRITVENIVNIIDSGLIVLDDDYNIELINNRGMELLEVDNEAEAERIATGILGDIRLRESIDNEDVSRNLIKYRDKELLLYTGRVKTDDYQGVFIEFNPLSKHKEELKSFDYEIQASSLLRTVLDSSNESFIYVNNEGIIEMISESYAEFLNRKKEDLIGLNVVDVVDNTRLDVVLKTGKSEIAQIQIVKGKKIIATRIPVYAKGKIVGAIGKILFRDVDELNNLYMKINNIEKELNLYRDEFKKANKAEYALESIIGDSPEIKRLKEMTKNVASTNSNVLILGESGTGKELFAHAIHNNSKRVEAPFIKVNCGAIPYELLESELFGYEEGAFTGAKKGGKIGKFKAADGGTIFLDEIADLPMNMQVKLLRVLQDRVIERIGSNTSEKVDVRVIAATNKNLEEMVEHESFRLDLYYRLNVVSIRIPSLRDRKDDIPLLSKHLINKISIKENKQVHGISNQALDLMKNYQWPGNIRELENILERAINFLGDDRTILPKHLPTKINGGTGLYYDRSLKETLEEVEKEVIIRSLVQTKGNKSKAAKLLNISRTSLYEKMDKYGVLDS
ncbi:sigma-54 interaction domain-containing protein [Gudongella sp. DL1XJH-153]|uniref:sigma-54 interaction domain-containing protein n=1 Tax=Gudongella sp. DL1XJH-153 TaxID=3409804 RepID=UPI003BB579E7